MLTYLDRINTAAYSQTWTAYTYKPARVWAFTSSACLPVPGTFLKKIGKTLVFKRCLVEFFFFFLNKCYSHSDLLTKMHLWCMIRMANAFSSPINIYTAYLTEKKYHQWWHPSIVRGHLLFYFSLHSSAYFGMLPPRIDPNCVIEMAELCIASPVCVCARAKEKLLSTHCMYRTSIILVDLDVACCAQMHF